MGSFQRLSVPAMPGRRPDRPLGDATDRQPQAEVTHVVIKAGVDLHSEPESLP
jgi:hypothetical protein